MKRVIAIAVILILTATGIAQAEPNQQPKDLLSDAVYYMLQWEGERAVLVDKVYNDTITHRKNQRVVKNYLEELETVLKEPRVKNYETSKNQQLWYLLKHVKKFKCVSYPGRTADIRKNLCIYIYYYATDPELKKAAQEFYWSLMPPKTEAGLDSAIQSKPEE